MDELKKLNDNKEEIEKKDKKSAIDYAEIREKAMADYLADVGPISKYINEQMEQISKEHSGKER